MHTKILLKCLLLGTILSLPAVHAQEEVDTSDAPLENVWPALSEPRFGDLDALLEVGEIRVLTTFTLGSYFIDRGEQRGGVFIATRKLETWLRERLGKSARRLKLTIIPVRRDQLLPFLNAGYGDVAFANLTITPERSELVDFSMPYDNKVNELLVTSPGVTDIESMDDLAGREIFVPTASSYFESINEVNNQFRRRGLAEIKVTPTDPRLEVEDLLEMLNANLLPVTVADDHRLELWSQVFGSIEVHESIVFRRNGELAFAMRKGSPS